MLWNLRITAFCVVAGAFGSAGLGYLAKKEFRPTYYATFQTSITIGRHGPQRRLVVPVKVVRTIVQGTPGYDHFSESDQVEISADPSEGQLKVKTSFTSRSKPEDPPREHFSFHQSLAALVKSRIVETENALDRPLRDRIGDVDQLISEIVASDPEHANGDPTGNPSIEDRIALYHLEDFRTKWRRELSLNDTKVEFTNWDSPIVGEAAVYDWMPFLTGLIGGTFTFMLLLMLSRPDRIDGGR